MKVCIVVGTRPEAIKMAPIYRELKSRRDVTAILLSTGQHREMLKQTLSAFDLTPDHDLGLMLPNQTLQELTARAISALSDYFLESKPDRVLVQGDTTSVLAGAIAAFYQQIPIGHVEAGLRTGNMHSPFPEEMNRRLTTPLCTYNFAPTEWSKSNLIKESIDENNIFVTGNTVIDALLWMREKIKHRDPKDVVTKLRIPADFAEEFLLSNQGQPKRMILVTGHRRESFGQGFEHICNALNEITRLFPEIGILYPVHLNPNVREPVNRLLSNNPRIALIEPAGYEDFIWLMDRAYFIVSDSGGVQEEAPSLGKPVLVMRDTTERPEGVTAGTCRLVGTDPERIVKEASILLNSETEYASRSGLKNPYGDGQSAKRICDILTA
ncbi:MAG: non-hydrolyzing UDP-N-acetylglucosamine 2-epimerase [Pirellula sp.]